MPSLTKEVIMPVLGMAQQTGKIVRWLKAQGQPVQQGEPLMEVETDKATVEIEAPASGILVQVLAREGEEVPVAAIVAVIAASESEVKASPHPGLATTTSAAPPHPVELPAIPARATAGSSQPQVASPLAARIAAEHHVDLAQVKPAGGRIGKADVLAYVRRQEQRSVPGRIPASPKARRMAIERGVDLASVPGSGPAGAVLAADVLDWQPARETIPAAVEPSPTPAPNDYTPGTIARIMAERTAATWTTVPHFYLIREVNASRLVAWRQALRRSNASVSYTDLLLKLAGVALRRHPQIRASWVEGKIQRYDEVDIGLAVAVDEGLVVPVLRRVDQRSLDEIAAARGDVVARARAGKLRPADLEGGTFTITNLGMYGVDVFNAVLNGSQAAILAVGRIADRVVPVAGQVAIQPMMTISISFDHRVIDGARGAQFLQTLAGLIEEPLELLS